MSQVTLSVVVPLFNEVEVIQALGMRLRAALVGLQLSYEVVFVDDGSTDATVDIAQQLQATWPQLRLISLSRNFGKEAATTAGLDHALGEAAIVMDADLQDPPELIPLFVEKWRAGYEVVYGVRTARQDESWFKKTSSKLFNRLMHNFSDVDIPVDVGDFRLLGPKALSALRSLRERHRYMKGLFHWLGFASIGVPYDRPGRAAGETHWNYRRLARLAWEGLTSFSLAPLKLATFVGAAVAVSAFAYATFFIVKTLAFGEPVRGFPTLVVAVLFLGGVQLLCVGILGEYIGRVYHEVKQRPLYLVAGQLPPRGTHHPTQFLASASTGEPGAPASECRSNHPMPT